MNCSIAHYLDVHTGVKYIQENFGTLEMVFKESWSLIKYDNASSTRSCNHLRDIVIENAWLDLMNQYCRPLVSLLAMQVATGDFLLIIQQYLYTNFIRFSRI